MTDLEEFKKLLSAVGQECKEDNRVPQGRWEVKGAVTSLRLEESDGYPGFWAEFLFDAEGKYITYAAWE